MKPLCTMEKNQPEIDQLTAELEFFKNEVRAHSERHLATLRQLSVTESNLVERTAQLEAAAAINAPPSDPVVDRQPEIDALSAELEKYKAELQLAVNQRNAAELQQRVMENNLKELQAQHG